MAPPPQIIPRPTYRDEAWDGNYDHASQAPTPIVHSPNAPGYDYRYRDEQQEWVAGPNNYYDPVSAIPFRPLICSQCLYSATIRPTI